MFLLAEDRGARWDEPAVLEGGADDGGFLGVVLHDERVADRGGVVGDDASEIGGGELEGQEIGLRQVGEDVEPYLGRHAVEREGGRHYRSLEFGD